MGRKSWFDNEIEREEYRKSYRKIYYASKIDHNANKVYCEQCNSWINNNNVKYHQNTNKHLYNSGGNKYPRYEIIRGEFEVNFNV